MMLRLEPVAFLELKSRTHGDRYSSLTNALAKRNNPPGYWANTSSGGQSSLELTENGKLITLGTEDIDVCLGTL